MSTITFPSSIGFLRALQCARLWSAHKSDCRPNLEGVRIEMVRTISGEQRPIMIATDGKGLWVRGRGAFLTAMPVNSSIDLTRNDVATLIGAIRATRADRVVTFQWLEGSRIFCGVGKLSIELERSSTEPSEFPPWRKVVPAKPKKVYTKGFFSAELMTRALKSLKPTTGSFAVRFEHGEKELDPVVIRGTVADEPAFVVLMPMRDSFDDHGSPGMPP